MSDQRASDAKADQLLRDVGLKPVGYPLIYAAAPVLAACLATVGVAKAISGESFGTAARHAIAGVLPHLSAGGQNMLYATAMATGLALAVAVARKPLERLTATMGRMLGQDQGPPVAISNERGYFVRGEGEADLRAVPREEFRCFRDAALKGKGCLEQIDVCEDGCVIHRGYREGVLNDWVADDKVVPAIRKLTPDGHYEFSWVSGGEVIAKENGQAALLPDDIYDRTRVYANPRDAAAATTPSIHKR